MCGPPCSGRWTQSVYPNTSLSCPQPGQTYTTVQTDGYQVTITYNKVNYDYRAKQDGTGLFLCAAVQGSGDLSTYHPMARWMNLWHLLMLLSLT